MIFLLKIIIGLFIILDFFVARHLFFDLRNTKKSEAYESSTIMQRFLMNFIFYFVLIALTALAFLLLYYIVAPITIG